MEGQTPQRAVGGAGVGVKEGQISGSVLRKLHNLTPTPHLGGIPGRE